MPQVQIHLGVWLYLLFMSSISRVAGLPSETWLGAVLSTNLIALLAFLAIFHLLTTSESGAQATGADYWLAVVVVGTTYVTGHIGLSVDIPLVMGGVAAYYYWFSARVPDGKFLGFVYFALMINGFLAPLLFQVFKPIILINEVNIATSLNRQFGLDMWADGSLIHTNNGVKLQMVGACSVFTNVSFAFLGYAAIKGFQRSAFRSHDWMVLCVLLMALVVGNSLRLGLMSHGMSSYEYWHHGDGAVVFGIAQFAVIVLLSLAAVIRWRRS